MRCKSFRYGIVGILSLTFATSIVPGGSFGTSWAMRRSTAVRIMAGFRSPSWYSISHDSVAGQRRGYFFDLLVVHFDDGNLSAIEHQRSDLTGGKSYVIDLLGERSLQSVELWYYKEPWDHNRP